MVEARAEDFSWAEVGKRITEWRMAERVSRTGLAERVALTQAGLLRIERGETNPRIETLQRIADALGYSVRELLFGPQGRPTNEGRRIIRRLQRIYQSRNPVAIKPVRDALETAEAVLGIRTLDPDEMFPPSLLACAKLTIGGRKGLVIKKQKLR